MTQSDLDIFLGPGLAICAAAALAWFSFVCYLRETRRRREALERDMVQYWARRRLAEQREAAAALDVQRGRAMAEAFYRRHGFYPSGWGRS